jgi:fibronectin-binding autotransporter adhesin
MRTAACSALKRLAACNGLLLGIVCSTLLLDDSHLRAQDVGAITNGNWNDSTIWTSGMAPGAGNSVYIGSNYPTGAALSATVTLTQDQQANYVYLGYSTGSSGTLNLGNSALTVGSLYVGYSGAGTVMRTTGSIIGSNLYVGSGSSFTFGGGDAIGSFNMSGSTATTASTGNITNSILLDGSSTLTLGAALSVSGSVDIRNGSILNAQNFSIAANQIFVGWNGNSPVAQLQNRGSLITPNLYVTGQNFNLIPSDNVQNFYLSGGNTTLPANCSLSSLNLYSSASASTLTSTVAIANVALNSSSTLTTSSTGNIIASVFLDGASTVTLGADLSVANAVDIRNGSILNAQNHNITANQIFLGWYGSSPLALLQNRGNLITPNLYVAAQSFNLTSSDNVQNFSLSGGNTTLPFGFSLTSLTLYSNASAGTLAPTVAIANLSLNSGSTTTTSATGNVTASVYIDGASALTLGADLTVTNAIDIRNGSILNAQNHNITANQVFLGWYGSSPIALLQNRGNLITPNLYVAAQNFSLTSSDNVQNFSLSGGNTTLPATYSLTSLTLYSASAGTLPPTVVIANLSLNSSSTTTTTSTGNVTASVYMDGASSLTLGADLTVSNAIDIRNGSTLNAQNHNITANQIFLGWYGSSPIAVLQNRGNLITPNLYVAAQDFNLTSNDNVQNFSLSGGNTVLPAGYSLTSLTLYGASAGTLPPTVAVGNLSLNSGSTTTTTSTGNVTASVYMDGASSLTLGADLTVANAVDIRNGSILNAQNHNITANQIFLDWYGGSPVALLQNRGNLITPNLYVAAQNFNLTSSDNVQNFSLSGGNTALPAGYSLSSLTLYGASAGTLAPTVAIGNLSLNSSSTVTTSATGNITASVYMDGASTLTLGADLNVTGNVDIRNGSTLAAQNHNIAANQFFFGFYGGTPVVTNLAAANVGNWYQGNGTQVALNNGNSSIGTLNLTGNSNLTVVNGGSNPATLTILGTSSNSISIAAGSQLTLQMNSLSGPILIWDNPTGGGDHIADLNALISAGTLTFTGLYSTDVYIYSNASITYITTPEPAWTLLIAAVPLAFVWCVRRRRVHAVPEIPCASVA